MHSTRLTKIIATLGPGSGNKKSIKKLVRSGVNVFRLNLSHGSHDVVSQWIEWIRQVEQELDTYIGILLDLQGPKIRLGKFREGSIKLKKGQRVVFTPEKILGDDNVIPIQLPRCHKAVGEGSVVYLDDGSLKVKVLQVDGRRVTVDVQVGGRLSDFKGVNIPDATTRISAITQKDKEDLKFGLREGVDFVALSFAGSADDIHQLRKLIPQGPDAPEIIAKIERTEAVKRLKEIVEAADGVMVARGDLGIETPLAEVPVSQSRILRECILQSKPVIIATQMLESMITNVRPTRAEVSDIANAVMACTDGIMLSGETAVGKHPTAAVEMMVETAMKTEAFQRQTQRIVPWSWFFKDAPPIHLGISYSANRLVELLDARALVVFTLSGDTAKMVSSPRPMVPVFAFTSSRSRARKLTLLRGVIPNLVKESENFMDDMRNLFRFLKKRRYLKKGDRIVIATGLPVGIPKWTNTIRVEIVP
jgi:pyruvate kinase